MIEVEVEVEIAILEFLTGGRGRGFGTKGAPSLSHVPTICYSAADEALWCSARIPVL